MNGSGSIVENRFGGYSSPVDNKPQKSILTIALIAASVIELILIIIIAISSANKTSKENSVVTTPDDSNIGDNVEQKTMAIEDFNIPLQFYAAGSLGLDQNRQTLDTVGLSQIIADYVGLYGGTAMDIAAPTEITSLVAAPVQNDIYPYDTMRSIKIGTAESCAELVFYPEFTILESYKLENGSCHE